jgi:hypothetical protein
MTRTIKDVTVKVFHHDNLEGLKAGKDLSAVRLVFIGDSVAQDWEPTMWNLFWGGRAPLNRGLWGRPHARRAWRLNNGQWNPTLRPQVVVLLIGTNSAQTMQTGTAGLKTRHSALPRSSASSTPILPPARCCCLASCHAALMRPRSTRDQRAGERKEIFLLCVSLMHRPAKIAEIDGGQRGVRTSRQYEGNIRD